MICSGIVLTCLAKFNMERSTSAVYHLLSGKKSIQTVHDAHLFGLGNFFHIYPRLTQDVFQKVIDENVSEDLLEDGGEIHKLTEKGKRWLVHYKDNIPYQYFNGLTFAQIDQVFYERLLLLIQVLANGKKQHFTYVPIIDNRQIINWIKKIYPKIKNHQEKCLRQLHDELSQLLQLFPDKEANIFVDRLTGYKHIGKSIQQLAQMHQMSYLDVNLLLTGMVHVILKRVHREQANYPFLSMIIEDFEQKFITESAQKTLQMMERYSIQEIAQIRNLKLNTIFDHIVEITLYDPSFPIRPYVRHDVQQQILNAVEKAGTSKLKTIKSILDEEVSYFQIRLTLAKHIIRN